MDYPVTDELLRMFLTYNEQMATIDARVKGLTTHSSPTLAEYARKSMKLSITRAFISMCREETERARRGGD